MQRKATVVYLLAVLLCVGSAWGQTLTCGRTTEAPVIDASPADDCWSDAMVATDFSVLAGGGEDRAFRQTTVRSAWDDDALYLHVICLEPDPQSITAEVDIRDGDTWLEDCVEVFLQPDTNKPGYLHFVVNAAGALYDERNSNAGFNAEVTLKAAIGEQAWQVELAIPWAEMGVQAPETGSQWGFNVGRVHRPQEPREWTTWAPLVKGEAQFAKPGKFGRLAFADQPKPGRVSGHADTGLIKNPHFADLANGAPASWNLSDGSRFTEIAPMSRHYSVWNDRSYGTVSRPLNIPVKAGDIFTVYAVVRGSKDAEAGIALVQEMEDGRPDDLYPFWQREVSGDYALYSGRIIVDKGAKRLFSLRLYRANKRGWIDYAYVQVYPGAHGLSGITDIEKCTRSDERAVGEPWPTPVVPAFKPLPAGPIKTLLFIGEFQRDAAELAQRLDIDYDLVYCPTFRGSGSVEMVVAQDADRVMRDLARGAYDLIILAGRPSEQSVIDGILSSVESGTGLVAVEPLAGGKAAHPETLQQLLDQLPPPGLPSTEMLGALEPQVLTDTSGGKAVLKSLSGKQSGEGRIARVTWSESVPGLTPFNTGVCEYWEYRWAALCKAALWAANRQPTSRIEQVTCGDNLMITLHSPQAEPLDLRVEWDGRFERLGSVEFTSGSFKNGAATVGIPMDPALRQRRGPTVARVLLSNRHGQALDIAACTVPKAAPRLALTEIEAAETANPGDSIPVRVKYEAAVTGGRIRVDLVDAFGRVVSRAEAPCEVGANASEMTLTVREPLSVYHRLVVSALDAGVLADRLERDLFVPAANATHLDDFALAVGYAAMHIRCPEYLQDHIVDFFRTQGVRATTVNEYMVQRGMPAFGGMVGAGMRYGGESSVRTPCFSDPAQVQGMAKRVVERIAGRRRWGFFGYNMDDETHLQQSTSAEVCTGPYCTRAFRNWARETYKAIAVANAQWSTSYAGFDDIEPPLLADMKGAANPSRWVDFRLFMDRVWANAYAATHKAVREAYPEVGMSFTNPYRYDSLSGTDFSLWVPNEEMLLRYFHRFVIDRNKSWSHAPMVSWFGYRSRAPECGHFVWWFALNGGVVPIWWDPVEPWAYGGKVGFTPWYMYGPLWQQTDRGLAVTNAAKDLESGIGRLLRLADAAPAEVAILHSQISKHVVYAQPALEVGHPTQTGYGRYRASDDAIAAAVKRHGFAYRYILPGQLNAEDLQGIKVVALPACIALSDESATALREFVARGGKLLADVMPATSDAHGKPRGVSPLAGLFDSDNAVCLGDYAASDSAQVLDDALGKLGIEPLVVCRTEAGALPTYAELYRFRRGEAQYLGVVRQPDSLATQEGRLTIQLPETGYAYDCRTGEFLGHTRELALDVPVGDARFIALLPYRPAGLAAQANIEGTRLNVSARIEGVEQPTDHVFRIEVTQSGADAPSLCYTRNLLAAGGRVACAIPLGLDDPAGRWRIRIRDVATGLQAEATAMHP